jgi:dihydroorotase
MPNTKPVLDNPAAVGDVAERARKTGVHIHPIGAISVNQEGLSLAPLRQMAEAGAIGFSDDGVSTISSHVMRQALEISSELNLPVMVHCEDPEMVGSGSMHKGSVSQELGDPGIPALAEESYIERDIELARETGGWIHVLHVSTVRGAEKIRRAKADGVRVTAEVMPHHLALTDEWVAGRRTFAGERKTFDINRVDPNAKVNPPLRPESDALGLIEYILDGTIDFIATDHAPHSVLDKPSNLSEAAFGMSGLEVALPTLQRLVERGDLDWPIVIDLLTRRPCETLNLPGGSLSAGEPADITLIDPTLSWTISEASLVSRSKKTPLLGMTVTGRAVVTIVGGKVLHDVRS